MAVPTGASRANGRRFGLLARWSLVAAACGCASGCFGTAGRTPAAGSTRDATWVDPTGNGVLRAGPGEPLAGRTALGVASRKIRPLVTFTQIADAHVTDEESPARVEMLDRLGSPFTSAFRPQESLTPFVLGGIVATIDRLRPAAVIETGDLIDNDQQNELDQALAVLRGGRVDPGSGSDGYQGVQDATNPDPLIYRPGVDAPRHPGLLTAAERPFTSPGLRAPWYPLPGNHDLLVQGNLAATSRTEAIAVGSRKLVTLDPQALSAARAQQLGPRLVNRLLAHSLPGQAITVAPDPSRRELPAATVIARLRAASGHGGSGPLMDDAFDLAPGVRAILLDTTRRRLGSSGILRPSQVGWLARQLNAAGRSWVMVFSSTPLIDTAGGEAGLRLLDADPHVVAAVAGDVHRNSIAPRRTGARGYWLITTSSLADYPQQGRAFRLWQTASGGVALETWMLNASPSWHLATISRQLAYLDYQGGRPAHDAGRPRDRNAMLYRAAP